MVFRRALPAFLQTRISQVILERNHRIVLESLRALSADGNTMVQETCVLAWGQVAR